MTTTPVFQPLIDWLIDLPKAFANVMDWLNTEYALGSVKFTPMGLIGVSLGAILAVIVALKIKSLIF